MYVYNILDSVLNMYFLVALTNDALLFTKYILIFTDITDALEQNQNVFCDWEAKRHHW